MRGNKKELFQKLDQLIDQHIADSDFSVKELALKIGYSRSHLHRIIYSNSGKSISQYIREYRLEKALVLLRGRTMNVSEVAYNVGFGSPSYFSKAFSEYFGFPPRDVELKEEKSITSSIQEGKKKRIKKRSFRRISILIVLGTILINAIGVWLFKLTSTDNLKEDELLSIALLPLTNLSDNKDNLYLCQGVGDAISRKLSSINNLRVVSRISTNRYEKENLSVIKIASELNTAYILNGSIQRHENKIRVEVSLLNGKNGILIWSDNFDREISDIFQIENEIAEKIASSISSTLIPSVASENNKGYTTNPEAYEFYLKGLYELRTYTSEGAKKSEEYFRKAVALDPEFAMAHNWLGHSFVAQAAMFGMELSALEGLEKAIVHIEKSIEIDPDLKEARPIRAFYYLYHDWDFEKAEKEYLKGLNNVQPESYALYADYLNFVRRHDEALEWSEKQELNEPYYPNTRKILSLFYTGKVEEAITYAENRLRIQKNYWFLDCYGFILLNSGRHKKSIDVFHEIFQIENKKYPRILGWLGAAHARSGETSEAMEIISELKEMKNKSSASSPGFFIAVVYSALGDYDSALHWLRVAVDDHEMEIPWLISEPQFFEMHNHPEFKKLVKKIGFPDFNQPDFS